MESAAGMLDPTPSWVRCECGHTRADHTFKEVECPGPDLCDCDMDPPGTKAPHVGTPCNLCDCFDLQPIPDDRKKLDEYLSDLEAQGIHRMRPVDDPPAN